MKILYDGIIFCGQSVTGVSRYFRELIPRITAIADTKVYFYKRRRSRDLPSFSDRDVNQINEIKWRRNGWLRILAKPVNEVLLRPIDQLNLRLRVGESAIFHSTYYTLPPFFMPSIVTVYDMIYEIFQNLYPKDDLFRKQKAKCIRSASHVICISENTRRDVLDFYNISEERVSVVYPGSCFPEGKLLDGSDEALEGGSLIPDHPFILYVGNRRGYKNFIKFIEAYASWKYSSNLSLVCVGGGEQWSNEEIASMVRLKISDRVYSLGQVPDYYLSRLYEAARFLVYPSLYEGFGLPALEALQCGTLVVLANKSSLPEVVGDCGFYFDPFDMESMQVAMSQAIELSPAERQLLIQKGLERAKKFSWDTTAQKIFRIYQQASKDTHHS